jgi:hypothetical protein
VIHRGLTALARPPSPIAHLPLVQSTAGTKFMPTCISAKSPLLLNYTSLMLRRKNNCALLLAGLKYLILSKSPATGLGLATLRSWTSSPLLSSRVGGDACSMLDRLINLPTHNIRLNPATTRQKLLQALSINQHPRHTICYLI